MYIGVLMQQLDLFSPSNGLRNIYLVKLSHEMLGLDTIEFMVTLMTRWDTDSDVRLNNGVAN